MKKVLVSGLALFLALPFYTHAAEMTSPNSITPSLGGKLQLLETQKESSASASGLNSEGYATLEILVMRMEVAIERVEKIVNRAGLRMEKLQRARLPISKLSTRYRGLTRALDTLKTEFSKVQDLSIEFQTEELQTRDYPSFRTQYLSTYKLLVDLISDLKSLVTDLKQYPLPTTKPTVTPKVIPTNIAE